ncbi:hypothetical protein NQ314_017636 [Rhamnusium bicolor]|uniref:J domain-containing protein n=1 Tax=Rhamnusium bicolor TaxID=1586634 RepID=A0AAV8WT14_9CUCU|nr:hypothetical protein NQ314_017636 [Rhamnusium bicolor]
MTIRNSGKYMIRFLNRSNSFKFKLNGFQKQTNIGTLNTFAPKRIKSGNCWNCGAERKNISLVFCEKCNMIQNPHEKENYFKVFDIQEKFNIDQQLLRSKFRKLQSLLHPDKFSNRTDQEKTISEEYSSLLNKAYSNLQVPLKRAEHLLNLKGEEVGESQSITDPSFLLEIMTLNEEVENANKIEKIKRAEPKK